MITQLLIVFHPFHMNSCPEKHPIKPNPYRLPINTRLIVATLSPTWPTPQYQDNEPKPALGGQRRKNVESGKV